MKFLKLASLTVILSFAVACGSGSEQANSDASSTDRTPEVAEPEVTSTTAICIWDQVSVRDTPDAKGKWLTSISVGEQLEYLGEDASDAQDDKKTYTKVKLTDGTEGWSRKDFIIPDGQVAVFLENNTIYRRPDLLTKTDDEFSQMDIIAITATQDDWVEVTGKREEGTWISTGWVKGNKLSKDATDVAVAKFGRAALNEEDGDKQKEALKDILDNSDLSSSKFIPFIEASYNALNLPEVEEVTADTVAADSIQ